MGLSLFLLKHYCITINSFIGPHNNTSAQVDPEGKPTEDSRGVYGLGEIGVYGHSVHNPTGRGVFGTGHYGVEGKGGDYGGYFQGSNTGVYGKGYSDAGVKEF